MTSQTATSTQPVPLSRLARLGIGLGLKAPTPSQFDHQGYNSTDEADWYIPYNGPYEQPKEVRRRVGRESWMDDPFGTGTTPTGATQGLGNVQLREGPAMDSDERRGRTRSRALSSVSRYTPSPSKVKSDASSMSSPRLRPQQHSRTPGTPSFLNLDATGIGESPVPVQRGADAWPAQAAANRGSFASFWTFGQAGSRKSPPAASQHSAEGWPRPSTSTQNTHYTTHTMRTANSSRPGVGRDYVTSVVGDSDRENMRDGEKTGQSSDSSHGRSPRPRANTALPSIVATTDYQSSSGHNYQPDWGPRPPEERHITIVPSKEVSAPTPYHHPAHPYALAFASSRGQHSAPPQVTRMKPGTPAITLSTQPTHAPKKVPPHLAASSHGFIKASMSTPNLRSAAAQQEKVASGSQPLTPNGKGKWLSAETWCDALIFPRPRFRMRAAHPISPPDSPVQIRTKDEPVHSVQRHAALPADTQLPSRANGLRNMQDDQKRFRDPPSALNANGHSPPLLSQGSVPPRVPPDNLKLKPPRPKSFAHDDLSLPSPVPSLARVLKEGEILSKERGDWNKQATRSFQNKRSRSLSRTRMKSLARSHIHQRSAKTSEEGSELAHSFDLLATSAFHGHQARKPSISVPSSSTSHNGHGTSSGTGTGVGTTSFNSHSRKSSGGSNGQIRGHSRKGSWGQTALKTAKSTVNATGLCAFSPDNNVATPVDEKSSALIDAISRDGTKLIRLGRGVEKKRDGDEDGVLLIASPMKPNADQGAARTTGVSPTPSGQSGGSMDSAAVGIAVSTPSALVPEPINPILFPDHPFSSGATYPYHGTLRVSDYAGPHPSTPKVTLSASADGATLTDVSLRHRLPPRPNPSTTTPRLLVEGVPHPYAGGVSRPQPSLRVPQPNPRPMTERMYAQVRSGNIREVLPEEFQYSPLSPLTQKSSPSHDSALGVEEALRLAFRRGSFDTANEYVGDPGPTRRNDSDNLKSTTADQQLSEKWLHPYSAREEVATVEAEPSTKSFIQSPPGSQPMNSQPADDHRPPQFVAPPLHLKGASSRLTSQESSPQTSPRAFGNSDDLDDLFYKPGQQSNGSIPRTPSSELVRRAGSYNTSVSSAGILDRSSSRGGSAGLFELTRRLTDELSGNHDDDATSSADYPSTLWGRNIGGHRSKRSSEDSPDPHLLLPTASSSPPGATLPLRLPNARSQHLEPSLLIPEDVESSRASSLLERPNDDEGTEVYYRLGEVPALATPDPTTGGSHRASAHVSYIHEQLAAISDQNEDTRRRSGKLAEEQQQRTDAHSSLAPPPSTATLDPARDSYWTNTSSDSRISRLSDFPVPPTRDVMTPATLLQSYFDVNTPAQQAQDPLSIAKPVTSDRNESHRTTFGEEDMPQLH